MTTLELLSMMRLLSAMESAMLADRPCLIYQSLISTVSIY